MAYLGSQVPENLLERLLEIADTQGYLTLSDIFEEVSAGELEEHLFRLVIVLRNQGVDVIFDDAQEDTDPEAAAMVAELEQSANLESMSVEDMVGLYFREMSRVPLLTTEEEVELAKSIERKWQAKEELEKLNGRCTPEQFQQLEAMIQEGVEARDKLIRANTRLVVSIAKRYISRGVPFLDLIQEGNLGLMKAVEKYDYRRGFRFSTYATWWIRQTITRSIADQGRTIRIPVHMTDRIRQMYRAAHDLEQKLGRQATYEELAECLGLEEDRVEWMMKVSWLPLSLEAPVGEDEETELGKLVVDKDSPNPSQLVFQKTLQEKVEEVLATLSPREALIIRLRYGFNHERPYTLEEVGQKFGLTRERIRQIEGKALRRLRHPSRARQLLDYI
ncbi:MAG: sigma-70 family RNA polymerase sigma factor [Chloroflexota bacterium]